jgi:hypothetical protein
MLPVPSSKAGIRGYTGVTLAMTEFEDVPIVVLLEKLSQRLLVASRFLRSLGDWARWGLEPLRRILLFGGLALGFLAVIRIAPVLYGRLALAHAVGDAARQSLLLGDEGLRRKLDREAINLGFPEAALASDAFRAESFSSEEGLSMCAITYDFTHEVEFCGGVRIPLRIHDRVERVVVEPRQATPVDLE